MSKLIDLSHTIEDGLVTYKGLPAPLVCDYMSREASRSIYSEGTSFHIGRIDMVANTGTYLDAPFHRYEDGKDVSELALESVASLDAIRIVTGPDVPAITADMLKPVDVNGKAVLIQTDWSRHWNTEQYYENHPYLTEGAAIYLRDAGAVLVGVDTYNIDDISGGERPVHSALLGSGIPIVEHMCNLDALPADGFRFYAVPVKVKGMGTFPVRAFAVIDE
ncbi:MAG: cyclase family protein [Gammaproteobacteria bacterium]|nr:cyclase family protein [Gammaproteobacteria bacterium]